MILLSLMLNEKEVAKKLLEIGAVKLNPGKPFTWASGWRSPIYCDNRKILSFPSIRNLIKNELSKLIKNKFQNAEMLAGVATAGIAWGALVADELQLPFIYVRPKPKEHGLGNQIEGFYESNKKVVVIEDLISTGKSSLQVVDVLKNTGLEVIGMVSIFNYGFDIAKENFAKSDITFASLTNYTTLINLAIEKGIVQKETEEILLQWKKDPANWNAI